MGQAGPRDQVPLPSGPGLQLQQIRQEVRIGDLLLGGRLRRASRTAAACVIFN
jgi:hypothetical protein